jgi:hypothetical protein
LEADLIEAIIGAIMIDSNYNYKITRYHTLLLISENVLKDIDLELFFEYVAKCKSEMLGTTNLKEDTFNIEQNKKDQFSGKNTEIYDKDKENNNVVLKDEKKFNNRVSNHKSLIIINDEINNKDNVGIKEEKKFNNRVSNHKSLIIINDQINNKDLENTQIKDEKGSNKIKIKEFDDINKLQENIDHNKNLNLEYSLYEDINNYAFDD